MSKQSGSALIPVIVAILIALGVGVFLHFKNISKPATPATSTDSLLKEEYSNPFDSSSSGAEESYQNPFTSSDYQNPFDAL